MLDKSRRVPRELFKTVFEDKKNRLEYLHSPFFSLTIAKGGAAKARAAVSVSKKVSKSAVVRNKVRRRGYSILRDTLKRTNPGIYLLSAKKGAEKIKFDDMKTEVSKLFSKFMHDR